MPCPATRMPGLFHTKNALGKHWRLMTAMIAVGSPSRLAEALCASWGIETVDPRARARGFQRALGIQRPQQMIVPNMIARILQLACLALLGAFAPALAEEPRQLQRESDRPEFLRLSRDESGEPLALETAIVRYMAPHQPANQPLEVDLVAAVHVGSREYFATLNHLFRTYDAVLYELVAPPNARVPQPGGRPSGAIGTAQKGMTRLLGLEFQLDQIDYRAANFVHADLSPQQFDAAMRKRGENWWTMFSKLMRESMARANAKGPGADRQPDLSFGDIFGLLFGSDRELRLRRILAEQFSDMDVLTNAFGGEDGSSLITDRNAAALAVLKTQLRQGRKSLAIFYGAAHMDDFDRRLRANFGLEPQETAWLEAWDLRERAIKGR